MPILSVVRKGNRLLRSIAYCSADKIYGERDGITHGRNQQSDAVNASAYISGENLHSEQSGKTHDYTRKRGVVHSEIMLPEHALKEFQDRATLWNSAELAEKQWNAQTARKIDIALQVEFSREEQIEDLRKYIKENFVDEGMCADWNIHDKKDGNPHVHIQLTMRPLNEDGTWGNKTKKEYILDKNGDRIKLKSGKGWRSNNIPLTDWDKPETLVKWRENWAKICNERFEKKGLDVRIDHRTLEAQGIDREPTIHIGSQGKALEKKGIITERVQKNRDIIKRNVEKGLSEYNGKRHEAQRLENRLNAMHEHAAQVRDEYGSEHFRRIYGFYPELMGEKYVKNLFDNEVEHIGNFSRQQLQENRKIDGSIKWYRVKVQEIEKEIADLLFEREKTSILNFKRRKSIKEQVEKLGEKKAEFEKAFYNKYNVEFENADILRTEQEELQVSRNYLEARKIKGALGKLKFEYKQNQSLWGETDLQSLDRRMEFIEKQEDDLSKIERNINDLQSKQTSVSSKKGLALEWETLQREQLTKKMIDEAVADIRKIKYVSSIQRDETQVRILRSELREWDKWRLFERAKAFESMEIQRDLDDKTKYRIYERVR